MIRIITTDDGSSSLYVEELDETYHSKHGAMAESTHIYINAGFKYLLQIGCKEINLFELGFGTGLNAILTYKEYLNHQGIIVNYTTVEKYPLDEDISSQLVYKGITDDNKLAEKFRGIHTAQWGEWVKVDEGFNILKIAGDIQTYEFAGKHNLIYYDAFAPSKQPEVWTEDVLKKITLNMQKNGVLITYCARGEFKRTLKKLGLTIESLPGPVGKKEITRGLNP